MNNMIKIVDRKRYNTETAEHIANWCNGYNRGDFHFCEEDLYRTKKGVYFIFGEGGALSEYSKSCGNGSCGSVDIHVITEDAAFGWLEKTGNVKAIESEFSDRIEDA